MYDYYVIKHNDVDYLNSVFPYDVSYSAQYYNAIQLTTQTMAEQFKLFCEHVAPSDTFTIYGVTVTIEEVTLNALGE